MTRPVPRNNRALNRISCWIHSIVWSYNPAANKLWSDMTDEERDYYRIRVLECLRGNFGQTMLLHEPDSPPGREDGDIRLWTSSNNCVCKPIAGSG